METPEHIFSLINKLSYPVLVLQKSDDNWSIHYKNEKLSALLQEDSEEKSLPKPIKDLLRHYPTDTSSKPFTLHHFEIFDSLYNINFEEVENTLFAFFVEVPLHDLFESLPFHDLHGIYNSVIVVLNTKGEIVDANECFCDLIGAQKASLEGKHFFDNFVPGNRDTLNHYFEHVNLSEDHQEHFITPLRGLDEHTHRINWYVSKIHWHEETYIIAVGSDISRFTRENTSLKKKLHSIQVGFDYFPFGIAYMNAKGKFTNMNARFMKMFKIEGETEELHFDEIKLLQKNIGFEKMKEYVKLIREMSYQIKHKSKKGAFKIKVDIRLLSGKKDSSKLYIIVVQKVKE